MSTYTPRHSVQDMIRRRMEKNRKIKDKIASKIEPKSYIMSTIEKFNQANANAKNILDSYYLIKDLKETLEKDFTKLDASLIGVELVWSGDDNSDIGQMRLEGIRVQFSDFYAQRTGLPRELNIDLTDMFLKVANDMLPDTVDKDIT